MSKKVRVGVVGCGKIAEFLHVPEYVRCEKARLVALCDAKLANARALAKTYGVAKVYKSHKEMFAREKLDAVSVCLPNYLHAPVTIDALNAGIHVMVEKPMAMTSAEAKRMISAARKNKRLLMVEQAQRYYPVHLKAKEIVDSGMLGRILYVSTMFGHGGPEGWSPEGKWFFDKKQAGFGTAADLGVHKADLIRFITGKEVAEVSAYTALLEKRNTDLEDNFAAALKFADGTLGTLGSSWTVKGGSCDYTILHCANGMLRINQIPDRPLVASLEFPRCTIEFEVEAFPVCADGTWNLRVMHNFVNAILGEEEPLVTGEDGKKALEIILAAVKSAKEGVSVKVG